MTSEKVEKYLALLKKWEGTPQGRDDDAILEEMDTVWYSMTAEEMDEVDPAGARGRRSMIIDNRIYREPIQGCRVCGGKLAMIRGRYPKDPDREVCPTCVVERLEDMVSSLQPAQCVKAQPQGSSRADEKA